ncbi:hypothetical protein [Enterobacter ludwigii]|uniref:hypothetical protein n=1 Tax=Enterobacter ludwigii TaxID=299767 RepID=UPI001E32CE68|nr:hypothetical protein [Enterobacter ludwigii]MCE1613381.1 hypothetical protein [Enterobacter ludwigii]MCE1626682.1 hypothetical protein [Enterobacter ludwigii]
METKSIDIEYRDMHYNYHLTIFIQFIYKTNIHTSMNKYIYFLFLVGAFLFPGLFSQNTLALLVPASQRGKQIAADMTKRFYNTADKCEDEPAWHCNGILIRAANASTRYHAWDPSPDSVRRGGISFSYFRSDLDTTRLQSARSQGFTLKGGRDGMAYLHPVSVLCSFPYDAGTSLRSDRGCGQSRDYRETSRACAEQGITTAEAWLKHFNSVPASEGRYYHQCSFDAGANGFATSLKARRLTSTQDQLEAWRQNELSIATWQAGIGEQLPIESFFYIRGLKNGNLTGLDAAKFMQDDYYRQTGIVIPVIRITFPEDESSDLTFTYTPSEQFDYRRHHEAISGAMTALFQE